MSETTVRRVTEENCYQLRLDGRVIGRVSYTLREPYLVLQDTEIDDEFSGRGLAGLLATEVFIDLRHRGQQAVVRCPYLRRWLRRNPDFADVAAAGSPRA